MLDSLILFFCFWKLKIKSSEYFQKHHKSVSIFQMHNSMFKFGKQRSHVNVLKTLGEVDSIDAVEENAVMEEEEIPKELHEEEGEAEVRAIL